MVAEAFQARLLFISEVCVSNRRQPSAVRRMSRAARFTFEEVTRQQYANPQFVQEFRKCRGDLPRPHERRWLCRLITLARARRRTPGLNGRKPLFILDIGTGYGRDLAWLQAQPDVFAVGIDYSLPMLQAGRAALRLTAGTLFQMDVRRLGMQDACVDVVRAQALLHNLTPPAANAALREIARVLKPGGLVYLFVRYGRWRGFVAEQGLGPRYFQYFTIAALNGLLRRHGLQTLEHERLIHANVRFLVMLAEKRF